MRIASKEAAAARKARHTHVMAMLNNAVPMKAKRVARVMMAKAAIVGKDEDEDTPNEVHQRWLRYFLKLRHEESPEEADTVAPVQRQALVKPTAQMQVFKRNDEALFAPELPETKNFKLMTEIDEQTHNAFNAAPNAAPTQDLAMDQADEGADEAEKKANAERRFDERYLDLESLKEDVSDKFRGRFGFYLHRNLMADLQELDCLQDMAKIVQAEVARIGRTYLDAIFLVAYDLLVLRGVDKQMAAAIIARVSVRYHLL
jgi:hypothetical protein